ncbi:MAG: putative Ig domain-containing protein [Terracidiphilus sp.]
MSSASFLEQFVAVPRAWFTILFCALFILCAADAPVSAQTAYFVGTVASPLPSVASDGPTGVAIDATGNIFFSQYFNSSGSGACASNCDVYEIPYSSGAYGSPVVVGTFTLPIGVAVDASDDVFVADFGGGQVYEVKPDGLGGWQAKAALSLGVTLANPIGVALDASGDLFVTDFANTGTSRAYEITFSGGSPSGHSTVGAAFDHAAGIAVDSAGNAYVVDNGASAVYLIASGASTNTQLASGFTSPNSVSVDGAGNVYVTDGGTTWTVKEIVATNGKAAGSTNVLVLNSSGLTKPYGLAVDGNGNLFVSDSNYGTYAIKEIMLGGVNLGSTAVAASTPLSQTLEFDVTTAGTFGAPAVLTTGNNGSGSVPSDFTLGTTTCSGAVALGTCSVTVDFTPQASGTRTGAVELLNSGRTAIVSTARVSGTGTGPQIAFVPGVSANLATGTTFSQPAGVAVDGNGSVYVADSVVPALYQIQSGASIATSLSSAFTAPMGVAVDGNGDVFVADPSGDTVKEFVAVNGSVSTTPATLGGYTEGGSSFSFSAPSGAAVDSAGNVYIVDASANSLYEILAASGYSVVTTLNSTFNGPEGVAVDSGGNVYVADTGNNAIKEIAAQNGHVTSSSTVSAVGGSFTFDAPQSVTVDGNGNVYVTDDAGVYEIPAGTNTVTTLVSGLSTSSGVAVDASDNIYYSNTGAAKVAELVRATPPTLTFAQTSVGGISSTQSLTVENVGNQQLTFSGLALPTDYIQEAGSGTPPDCSSSTALAEAGSCNLGVALEPQASPISATEYVTLTDNSLNVSSATQQIPLTGTAIAGPTATQQISSEALTENYAASFTPVTGSGGEGSLSYSISPTLPSGLGISLSSGAISGTPTVTLASTSYTVTVTDSDGATATASFNLTVNAAVSATTAVSSTSLTENYAASFTPVTGSGGTGTLTYSISGTALPAGLSISSSTGLISGTPTVVAAQASYTVQVTDTDGASATASFNLTVNAVVSATTAVSSTSLTENYAASFTPVTASGGTGTLTYSISGTALPAGLSISSSTGLISGTPTAAAAQASYTVKVTDTNGASATASFNLTVNAAVSATTAVSSTSLTENYAASFTPVTASGGTGTLTYSISGAALPAGLSISSSTGLISGTPTVVAAQASYTVKVTDANGASATASFNLTVNALVSATTAVSSTSLTENYAASFTPVTASGGTGTLTYSISGTALPAGLSISSSTGLISGTPTAATAQASYTVKVTDADGASATASFNLTVNAAVTATTAVSSTSLTVNYAASFTPVTGSGGTTPLTYSISGTALPAGLSISSSTGLISGTPTAAAAQASYTVKVTDADGASATASFSLTVNAAVTATTAVSSTILAENAAASFTPVTGSGGTGTLTYSISGTALPAGLSISSSTGLISGTPTAVTAQASYTVKVTDSDGASATASFSLTVVTALDFTLTNSGSTSQTVNAGGSAAYQFAVAPVYTNYAGTVSFAATGLPTGATATFSPSTIAVTGGQQTVTMTVVTSSTASLRQLAPGFPAGRNLQPFALAFLVLLGIGGMRRQGRNLRRLLLVVLFLVGGAATLLTGCVAHTTSPQTYTITVTATSGTLQHSSAVSLTVE